MTRNVAFCPRRSVVDLMKMLVERYRYSYCALWCEKYALFVVVSLSKSTVASRDALEATGDDSTEDFEGYCIACTYNSESRSSSSGGGGKRRVLQLVFEIISYITTKYRNKLALERERSNISPALNKVD